MSDRYKVCSVCGARVDTLGKYKDVYELYFHEVCFELLENGEARGSEGEQVVVPELLAVQGRL